MNLKEQILSLEKDGKISVESIEDLYFKVESAKEFLKAIRELKSEGKIRNAFELIPGTTYDMSYVVIKGD